MNMSLSDTAISALLPVKNGQLYLEKLLPTILKMLEGQDELIVINDGSSDDSQDLIEKFESIDSRLVLINTEGIGLVSALNLGVNAAKNEWVARFDVDDNYLQNRLEEQRRFLRPGVSVVFSDYDLISESGRSLGKIHSAVFPIPTALSLITSQRTAHPSTVINRKLLLTAGGYQIKDFPAEDLALWLRMSPLGEIVSVPLPLLRYTLSRNSISAQNRERQQKMKSLLIQGSTLWPILQLESISKFEETLIGYRKISHTPERLFFHLRDLYLARRLTHLRVPFFQLLLKIDLVLLLKVTYAAAKILLFVILRKAFRIIYR
jgi:glycosyltransferase involved in cell wall biosynthesis